MDHDVNTSVILYDPKLDSKRSVKILDDLEHDYDTCSISGEQVCVVTRAPTDLMITSAYFVDPVEPIVQVEPSGQGQGQKQEDKLSRVFRIGRDLIELSIVSTLYILIMNYYSLHVFFGSITVRFPNDLTVLFTIDAILSAVSFYTNCIGFIKYSRWVTPYELNTFKRYTYYVLIYSALVGINFMFWFRISSLTRYMLIVLAMPSAQNYIHNQEIYQNIVKPFYSNVKHLWEVFVCKQLTKIVNQTIANTIQSDVRISYLDLLPYYNKVSISMVNQFIVSFGLAHLFNYVDKGGMRLPMMIYKNIYMKDETAKIRDDKKYIETIVENREWNKLVDIYSLNRLIRLMVTNESDLMSKQVDMIVRRFVFSFNRVMFCWTVLTVSNLPLAILSFLPFVQLEQNKKRYIITTFLSLLLGVTVGGFDQILLLILCEMAIALVNRSFVDDGIKWVNNNSVHIFTQVYHFLKGVCTSETFMMSILLSLLPFNVDVLSTIIWIELILVLLYGLFRSDKLLQLLLLLLFGSCSHLNFVHMLGLPFMIKFVFNL